MTFLLWINYIFPLNNSPNIDIYFVVRIVRLSVYFLCICIDDRLHWKWIIFHSYWNHQYFFLEQEKKENSHRLCHCCHRHFLECWKPSVYPLNIYDFQDYFLFNLIASGLWAITQTMLFIFHLYNLKSSLEHTRK